MHNTIIFMLEFYEKLRDKACIVDEAKAILLERQLDEEEMFLLDEIQDLEEHIVLALGGTDEDAINIICETEYFTKAFDGADPETVIGWIKEYINLDQSEKDRLTAIFEEHGTWYPGEYE